MAVMFPSLCCVFCFIVYKYNCFFNSFSLFPFLQEFVTCSRRCTLTTRYLLAASRRGVPNISSTYSLGLSVSRSLSLSLCTSLSLAFSLFLSYIRIYVYGSLCITHSVRTERLLCFILLALLLYTLRSSSLFFFLMTTI